MVWKGGEWWLVAAPLHGEAQRYRLNHVDRIVRTDLNFTHPEDKFDLRLWWTKTLEECLAQGLPATRTLGYHTNAYKECLASLNALRAEAKRLA